MENKKDNLKTGTEENINLYEKSKGIIIDEQEINDVQADIVKMTNSCAKNIKAKNNAKLDQSCTKNIVAKDITADKSAAFKINADKSKFSKSLVVLNDASETVQDSSLNISNISDTVNAQKMNNIISFSTETTAKEITSGIFLGKNIKGNVTTIINSKTAAIMGAAFGFIYFMLKFLFKKR